MTITVQVRNTGPRLFQRLRAKYPQAEVRALNRALMSAETFMSRSVASDTGLKVGDVKKAFRSSKATLAQRVASIGASLKKIPLIAFGAIGREPSRGKGPGVSYRLQAGGRKRIKEAFIARVASQAQIGQGVSHKGVFVRDLRRGPSVKKSVGAWSKNLPIRQLYGVSLGYVFRKYLPQGQKTAEESLAKNLKHELRFALSQDRAA